MADDLDHELDQFLASPDDFGQPAPFGARPIDDHDRRELLDVLSVRHGLWAVDRAPASTSPQDKDAAFRLSLDRLAGLPSGAVCSPPGVPQVVLPFPPSPLAPSDLETRHERMLGDPSPGVAETPRILVCKGSDGAVQTITDAFGVLAPVRDSLVAA